MMTSFKGRRRRCDPLTAMLMLSSGRGLRALAMRVYKSLFKRHVTSMTTVNKQSLEVHLSDKIVYVPLVVTSDFETKQLAWLHFHLF